MKKLPLNLYCHKKNISKPPFVYKKDVPLQRRNFTIGNRVDII